jgi:hypothetical protein
MPRKALAVSAASAAIAACLVCSLINVRASEAPAAMTTGYPSASTQVFDATPIGGELGTFAAVAVAPAGNSKDAAVKAQIFDPDVLGAVRSKFSGMRSIAGNVEAGPTLEGRSVGSPVLQVPQPVKQMAPEAPQECSPRPSAGTAEPQFGSAEPNEAVA